METALSAVALLASLSLTAALFGLLLAVCVGFLAIILYWFFVLWGPHKEKIKLSRHSGNPVLGPEPSSWWQSEAVFNPGAFVDEGMVHLFYRALGRDGVSRIGHATSVDGVHFTRSDTPVYDWGPGFALQKNRQYPKLSYNTDTYASGGGWGGCEDPRAVLMKEDGAVYMTFGVFEGWQSIRMAVTSLGIPHLRDKRWWWSAHIPMSPKGETHKNWVLFPEKINGKYAILHALTPVVLVDYLDSIEDLHDNPIQSNNQRSGREGQWDAFVRGAGAPPIKTPQGWLLFYHGMNPEQSSVGYRVGAMLLDLDDPTRILYRSNEPILEPKEWYENDWKPGVVYASGAVILDDDLIVYYGGGDKYIAAAKMNAEEFLEKLASHSHIELSSVKL